jgi:hypothetical protein
MTVFAVEARAGTLRVIYVETVEELQLAVRNARAGDEIVVASGRYNVSGLSGHRGGLIQSFGGERGQENRPQTDATSGTAAHPIILRGADPANRSLIYSTNVETGTIIHIWDSDFWVVRDLEVRGGQRGILFDNVNHGVIRNNYVHSVGLAGIHLRDGSSYNQVIFNFIDNTGLHRPGFGEGVYVGSAHTTQGFCFYTNFNYIGFNGFGASVRAEPVDVKEFATGTVIEQNIMNGAGIHGRNTPSETHASSFVTVKGNDTIVRHNTFLREGNTGIRAGIEVHRVVAGWGYGTVIYGNFFDLGTADSWGPVDGDPTIWPINPSHPVFAVGVWSGSALIGENAIAEPDTTRNLSQFHRMSDALPIVWLTQGEEPQPDPRVPVITVCTICGNYPCQCAPAPTLNFAWIDEFFEANRTHAQAVAGSWNLPQYAIIRANSQGVPLPGNNLAFSARVTWGEPQGFDPAATRAQTVTFTGLVTLPYYINNPNNLPPETIFIVNVAAPPIQPPQYFTVLFNLDVGIPVGGGIPIQRVEPGGNAVPPILTSINNHFAGWSTANARYEHGIPWTANSAVTEDITLYSTWFPRETPVQWGSGDINMDGQVTSADAVALARFLTGHYDTLLWETLPICLVAARVQSGTFISVTDLVRLQQRLAGNV